ncbi:MAG: exodeoxyribonuclease VII large subunit [Ignavibacteria bacterium RIFOXYB2_FULL_35_12]|nr:MAG: exodeoxyribonuclease VII large subunit [Ignavibacteria bacterium GWA2_36_19]OGU51148.1 MAG: exodeoxyribonuclease VII large subunit [Ignavibacteria bacterium GWC2_35_8]OGU59703.1 MAG: exodeoxyribonuclease VII large subunit [Ignavibacteria bacterium GWF2_35_20]OGU80607.1 MAG: exodeoxyribonuclease VII large subunit [Ignavibacteria bacterium RIFOXYA2_FULL_35_9]OGU85171.1 MAG: exodeoxyribonuclease VII large subunit [Ignavibacteria bacterium RIFOXYA12_FULL_35_25]OGU91818.1 MAG: exodeoxyribon
MQDLFTNIKTISVSELTKQIKLTLEENFSEVSVIGEMSNFKAHVSGHWYFNLKDANAVISCAMWKGLNNYVFFTPQDGMKIIVSGRITVYPPRGSYQIDVRSMKPAGVGELQAAFEMLKRKLADEGLFDEIHKKPMPSFPQKIGIVTAKDGAAFQDMISVAERRFPLVELVISPARVQGSGAAESIVESIKLLNKQKDIDLIIIARGGGSIEDLWAFNEEIVAREIFASKIPIITGIGHEVDFTISDFVADLRAPTPSAAMEIATPDKDDFFVFINEFSYNSSQKLEELCSENRREVNQILSSYGFRYPFDLVRKNSQLTDILIYKILNGIDKKFVYYNNVILLNYKIIQSHSVQKTLKKGYVLVNQDSHFVKRAEKLKADKPAILQFIDGDVEIMKKSN